MRAASTERARHLANGGKMEILVVGLVVSGIIYFLPVIIALSRSHPQWGPIFVVNLFLGWTLVGWVIALAWSVGSFKKGEAAS